LAAAAPRLIAVVGPTAAGKSALALRLALARRGEIVSCDSLQVYRGLDVGSAKATPRQRAAVPHHLLDVAEPDAPFSAADYGRLARRALGEIRGRGNLAIVAGGTGLYLRALLQGLFEGPSRDPALRQRLHGLAERYGDARLHRALARVDPEAARRIAPRDRLRVVRALEVYRLTRRPISEQQRGGARPLEGWATLVLGLDPGRETLRRAVERRTRQMMERGLLAEVRGLISRFPPTLRPLQAIGYRQALAVVQGRSDAATAERDIVAASMRYAKRQLTWFRHQTQVHWCPDGERAFAVAIAWLDGQASV
jgi:tRNA dimethylallyltransferase